MPLKNGCYLKLWSIEHKSPTWAKVRCSTSVKRRDTGEYETDFTGYVDFKGSANVQHLSRHKDGDRIIVESMSVTTPKRKEGEGYYMNLTVWEFKDIEDADSGGSSKKSASKPVDDGEPEGEDGSDLPW